MLHFLQWYAPPPMGFPQASHGRAKSSVNTVSERLDGARELYKENKVKEIEVRSNRPLTLKGLLELTNFHILRFLEGQQ